jgi:hypothetical protein
VYFDDKMTYPENTREVLQTGTSIKLSAQLWNGTTQTTQISRDNFFVPFYDDMTGFVNSRYDLLMQDVYP